MKVPTSAMPRGGSGAMFDRIAARYDLLNRLLSFGIDRRWRKRTVRALALGHTPQVLDLATGTADVALEVARQHPDAHIEGLDPSSQMLERGRAKIRRAGREDSIRLREGEAEALPFEADRFDAVTIAFGIRNVADRAAGLREMARVTRPGGRIAILELSEPEGRVMGALARFHIHTLVPRLGALLSGAGAYDYLQESIGAFPAPDVFAGQIRDAGLDVLRVEPLTFGVSCLFVATPASEEVPS